MSCTFACAHLSVSKRDIGGMLLSVRGGRLIINLISRVRNGNLFSFPEIFSSHEFVPRQR